VSTTIHGPRGHTLPTPSSGWAWFFDLDGTLIELAEVPSGVHVDDAVRGLIGDLAAAVDGAVAVITGRPISDIDRLFPDFRLPVAGQHGVERRDALGHVTRHDFDAAPLDVARRALMFVAEANPGLLLEDKGMSLALHYRQAPTLGSYAHRFMRALQARAGAEFCVQSGKKVVELKPCGRDKGDAITAFMQENPFRGRMPVFIGDDVTDELGFDVVNAMGGVSVKVGAGRTRAAWQLRDVTAVRTWLARSVRYSGAHLVTVNAGGT
jgi:trehalose 6-phosphate phosphatase